MIGTFAVAQKEVCTKALPITGIVCTLVPRDGGRAECRPISDEHPLTKAGHFVAGSPMPEASAALTTGGFTAFYASLGVATIPTVCDGDCALDVMSMMLGEPESFASRKALRVEISDYLISRAGEPWMHELMARLQELRIDDFEKSKCGVT